jgi:hypothetical protein
MRPIFGTPKGAVIAKNKYKYFDENTTSGKLGHVFTVL